MGAAMGDALYFLVMIYGVITAFWFCLFVSTWRTDRKRPWSTSAEQHWTARMALAAPLWPYIMLRFVGPPLMQRIARVPSAFGRGIGEFMFDATRRGGVDGPE